MPGVAAPHLTPIDLPIPESVADEMRLVLTVADTQDGSQDGEIHTPTHSKLPIKLSIFGLHLSQTISLDGTATIHITD